MDLLLVVVVLALMAGLLGYPGDDDDYWAY